MSDREALMRAILEAPDDDAPRLIFADWLEENGWYWDATHLRQRVALPRTEELQIRAALLRGLHPLEPMPEWTRMLLGRAVVSRGFVQGVELEPMTFLEIAADLFAFQPVTQVQLIGARPKRDFWAWTWEWGLAAARDLPASHVLPKPIHDSLDRTTGPRWPTEEAAELELSRACVRYGRRLAGLPPPVLV